MAACLGVTGSPTEGFADFEAQRRQRVERIVSVGARSSRSKTAGPLTRPFLEMALRVVFRYAVTGKSQA